MALNKVINLKVNGETNPTISDPCPTISWDFSTPNPGKIQTKYRVEISDDGTFAGGDIVRDSGIITSSNTYWTVTVPLTVYGKYWYRIDVWGY